MIHVRHMDAEPRADLIVFVAPNNPEGCGSLQMCVEAALGDETRLVPIDEAYYEFPRRSYLPDVSERVRITRDESSTSRSGTSRVW